MKFQEELKTVEFAMKSAVGGGVCLDGSPFLAAKQLGSEAAKLFVVVEFVKLFSLTIRNCLFSRPNGFCRVKTIDNCFARGLVEFVSELGRTYKFKRGVQKTKNSDRATECAMTNIGESFSKIPVGWA